MRVVRSLVCLALLALTLPASAGVAQVEGELVAAGYEYGYCCDRVAAIFWLDEQGAVHARVSACRWAYLGDVLEERLPTPCPEWEGVLTGGSMIRVDTAGPVDDVAVTGTLPGVGTVDLVFASKLPYKTGDTVSRGSCVTNDGIGTNDALVWHAAHTIGGRFVVGAEMQGQIGSWYFVDEEPTEWGCAHWGANASARWAAR